MSEIIDYCIYYFCIQITFGSEKYQPFYKILKLLFDDVSIRNNYLYIRNQPFETKQVKSAIFIHPIQSIGKIIPLPDLDSIVCYNNRRISFVRLLINKYLSSNDLLCNTVLKIAKDVKATKMTLGETSKIALATFLIMLEKELFPSRYWIFHKIMRDNSSSEFYKAVLMYLNLIEKEKQRYLGFKENNIEIGDFRARVYEIDSSNESRIWKIISSRIEKIILSD